jgi:hypothetical protein
VETKAGDGASLSVVRIVEPGGYWPMIGVAVVVVLFLILRLV